MPRLLRNDCVQLHMPRTGGHSLARQVGQKKLVGTIHDGPGQIPDPWKDKKIITTFRGPESWRLSMAEYLDNHSTPDTLARFLITRPVIVGRAGKFDPTFGLWDDPSEQFKKFIIANEFNSWYEAFSAYFIEPAHNIIPMEKLKVHVNKI